MKQKTDDFNQTICGLCGKDFHGKMKDKVQELVEHHAKCHDERPSSPTLKRRRDYE